MFNFQLINLFHKYTLFYWILNEGYKPRCCYAGSPGLVNSVPLNSFLMQLCDLEWEPALDDQPQSGFNLRDLME